MLVALLLRTLTLHQRVVLLRHHWTLHRQERSLVHDRGEVRLHAIHRQQVLLEHLLGAGLVIILWCLEDLLRVDMHPNRVGHLLRKFVVRTLNDLEHRVGLHRLNPRVFQEALSIDPLTWILLEALDQEVTALHRYTFREGRTIIRNNPVERRVLHQIEVRWIACQRLDHGAPQRPYIT